MTLIVTFGLEDDLGSSILFRNGFWMSECYVKEVLLYFLSILVKTYIFLYSRYVNYMQISYYANKKVAAMATNLNFLQYTYIFRVNNKTLYSQLFQVTWVLIMMVFLTQLLRLVLNK